MDIAFQASGKILGLNSSLVIVHQNKNLAFIANLDTNDSTINQILSNEELGVNNLIKNFSFTNALNKTFSLAVIKSNDLTSFEFLYDIQYVDSKAIPNLYCNLILVGDSKQFVFTLNTKLFKGSNNSFEAFVYSVLNFLAIDKLSLVIRNSAKSKINKYLKDTCSNYLPSTIFDAKYNTDTLLVNTAFVLKDNKNVLAKSLYLLTGIDNFQLVIAANSKDTSFKALLFAENIDKTSYKIERLSFGIEKKETIKITAEGKLSFKLENKNLEFTIAGEVSPTSFTLSATSNFTIPLNNKIAISDLGLIIGVSSGVIFGMTGRTTIKGKSGYTMSIFAGFIIDIATPKVNLLTTAMTSTTGKISLRDIIVEIAEIDFLGVESLDMISIQDFELQTKEIQNWSIDRSNEAILSDFNSIIPTDLSIKSEDALQITTLDSTQAIITDKDSMRHYRINNNGKVSLNCQLYICTQSVRIGQYQMPAGFFLCGTLEVLGFKCSSLFLIEPGNSIVALVQFSPINIKGIIEFTRSKKSLPMEPINGGLAGALVKVDSQGPVFYLNINKNQQILEVYFSAYLNILNIFKLDTLVLIKDKRIYIDTGFELLGFKLLIKLDVNYNNFSEGNFNAKIVFDTTEFVEILKVAQESIKKAALAVEDKIKDASRKIDEAKSTILNLNNNISTYNSYVNEYSHKRSKTSWWRVDDKIWYSAQILYYEGLKIGIRVALGVAYGVLEVAQLALKFGGAAVSGVLNGIAHIVSSITNLLWINRFELEVIVSSNEKKIKAQLDLTVLGQNVTLPPAEIDFGQAINNLKALVLNFVKDKIMGKTQELTSDIEKGKITKNILDVEEFNNLNGLYQDIDANKSEFYEILNFQDSLDDFLVKTTSLYYNQFSSHPDELQKNLVELSEVKLQNDIIKSQCVEAFDDDFVKSLDNVILYVQNEQTQKNANDEVTQEINNLSSLVKALNSQSKISRSIKDKSSLFERVDESFDQINNISRAQNNANNPFDLEQSNKNYADGLSNLLKSLPDSNSSYINQFKTQVATDIYGFNNPPNDIEME